MKTQKEFFIKTAIIIALLIPITMFLWDYSKTTLNVFFLHKQDYVIKREPLTFNKCKKYGGGANFNISFKGQVTEGRDGCLFAADSGDVVKVYFNKRDLYNNGIIWVLIRNLIIQWVVFLALAAYLVRSVYMYVRLS